MSDSSARESTNQTHERMRKIILGGGHLLLDDLDPQETEAMQRLILSGEGEIISSACRAFLSARVV